MTKQVAFDIIKKVAIDYFSVADNDYNLFVLKALLDTATAIKKVNSVQKEGKWIEKTEENRWHCSVCGTVFGMNHYDFNYCPICGSKMEESDV